jgi:hypothetical protein
VVAVNRTRGPSSIRAQRGRVRVTREGCFQVLNRCLSHCVSVVR